MDFLNRFLLSRESEGLSIVTIYDTKFVRMIVIYLRINFHILAPVINQLSRAKGKLIIISCDRHCVDLYSTDLKINFVLFKIHITSGPYANCHECPTSNVCTFHSVAQNKFPHVVITDCKIKHEAGWPSMVYVHSLPSFVKIGHLVQQSKRGDTHMQIAQRSHKPNCLWNESRLIIYAKTTVWARYKLILKLPCTFRTIGRDLLLYPAITILRWSSSKHVPLCWSVVSLEVVYLTEN
jgi:hypothetical protein